MGALISSSRLLSSSWRGPYGVDAMHGRVRRLERVVLAKAFAERCPIQRVHWRSTLAGRGCLPVYHNRLSPDTFRPTKPMLSRFNTSSRMPRFFAPASDATMFTPGLAGTATRQIPEGKHFRS